VRGEVDHEPVEEKGDRRKYRIDICAYDSIGVEAAN